MDGHNNYIIVNFNAYCMKHIINSFILFSHTLHFLQSFNVNVFAFLKCILIEELN